MSNSHTLTEAMIEAGREVLWGSFCPGIRREQIDDEHYRGLALSTYLAMEAARISTPSEDVAKAKAAILAVGIGGGSTFDAEDRDDMAQEWAEAVVAALKETTKDREPSDYCGIVQVNEEDFLPTKETDREALLLAAGNRLSIAAQTSGGTAGRDDELVAAIDGWTRASSASQRG